MSQQPPGSFLYKLPLGHKCCSMTEAHRVAALNLFSAGICGFCKRAQGSHFLFFTLPSLINRLEHRRAPQARLAESCQVTARAAPPPRQIRSDFVGNDKVHKSTEEVQKRMLKSSMCISALTVTLRTDEGSVSSPFTLKNGEKAAVVCKMQSVFQNRLKQVIQNCSFIHFKQSKCTHITETCVGLSFRLINLQ